METQPNATTMDATSGDLSPEVSRVEPGKNELTVLDGDVPTLELQKMNIVHVNIDGGAEVREGEQESTSRVGAQIEGSASGENADKVAASESASALLPSTSVIVSTFRSIRPHNSWGRSRLCFNCKKRHNNLTLVHYTLKGDHQWPGFFVFDSNGANETVDIISHGMPRARIYRGIKKADVSAQWN